MILLLLHFFLTLLLKMVKFQVLLTINSKDSFSRSDGVLNFKVDVPIDSEEIRIIAKLETEDYGQVQSSAYAYKTHTNNDHYIHVRSSTKHIAVGEYVVFMSKLVSPLRFLIGLSLVKTLSFDLDVNMVITYIQKSKLSAWSLHQRWHLAFILLYTHHCPQKVQYDI